MKYSVTSYSFNRWIKNGQENQISIIQKAKDYGFDGIEFTELTPHDGSTKEEYALKIKAECERVGLEIVSYTIGADLFNKGEAEVERLKGEVDIAAIMGAKRMRHDICNGILDPVENTYHGFHSIVEIVAPRIREVTEYAASKGIMTMSENHGRFAQDADRVEKLINAVGHPNYGWLVDIGNFLCADENPAISVGKAAPYARHVHAKDFFFKNGNEFDPGQGAFVTRAGNFLRGTIIGHGIVPVRQCMQTLIRAGYNGYATVEFEGLEEIEIALKIGLENLKRACE